MLRVIKLAGGRGRPHQLRAVRAAASRSQLSESEETAEACEKTRMER